MLKIKRGDRIIVTTGKDKGREGTVLKVLAGAGDYAFKVVVEGVNMIKKHMKGNPSQGQPGGIIEKEAALHYSNVSIVNPTTGKADRVGFKILEDGRKVRIFKSNSEVIVDG